MPAELRSHLVELWSRPAIKPPSAGIPCRLWLEHYRRFCEVSAYPTAEELDLVHFMEVKSKEGLKRQGLLEEYEQTRTALLRALQQLRLAACTQASGQFQQAMIQHAREKVDMVLKTQPTLPSSSSGGVG